MDTSSSHRSTAVFAAALLLGALTGCGGGAAAPADAAAPVSWPEGTALVFGGTPVSAEEIDRHVELIHLIEPHLVKSDHRRKALTNIVLPVVAGRVLYPDERQAAFERAQALAAEAREVGRVPEGAPEPIYLTGAWREVGMPVWDEARRTEAGSFSRVVETPGAWTFVHLLAVGTEPGEAFGPMTQITVQRYDVRYIDQEATRATLQSAMDQLELEIVDPEWEKVVPASLLYPRTAAGG
ncbi:MAG: hypothetical protein VX015_07995 [Planctomycetota bacterium]|nr:hypothetical protein [Planctomycetota bacterium]